MTDTAVLDEVQAAVAEAHTVVFLGCAYHPQNIDLIRDNSQILAASEGPRSIFGTTFGMSAADKANVEGKLVTIFRNAGPQPNPRIFLADATCAEFLRQYRRTLSAD